MVKTVSEFGGNKSNVDGIHFIDQSEFDANGSNITFQLHQRKILFNDYYYFCLAHFNAISKIIYQFIEISDHTAPLPD